MTIYVTSCQDTDSYHITCHAMFSMLYPAIKPDETVNQLAQMKLLLLQSLLKHQQ